MKPLDPMQQLDLILLEELTMHLPLQTNRRARLLKAAVLTAAAVFFIGASIYEVRHPSMVSAVAPIAHGQAMLDSPRTR